MSHTPPRLLVRSRLFWSLTLATWLVIILAVVAMMVAMTWDGGRIVPSAWAIAALAIVAGAALSAWIAARMVQSIQVVSAAVRTMSGGDFSRPLEIPQRDELGLLAEDVDRLRRHLEIRLAELRASAQMATAVLGGMDQGVIAIGANRHVLLANPAARQMLELSSPTAQGASMTEVLPDPHLREATLSVFRESASRHLTLERNGATQRVLGVQANPMPGSPCPGVVLVLHDETELRRLETLRQEFVANVSHELKTPLSSIKAYAETLSQGAIHDPANNLRFVARIEEQADRLHQLILDLLRLARIESGEQSFDIAAVPVAKVVEACLANQRDAAEAKAIQVVWQQPDSQLRVRADEEGLRQILDNLVDNAVKYTLAGGTVTVRAAREGRVVKLEVEDTGIGIPKQFQPRVFERFFRVDKARSRELGGTGLGLSIVKHLAQSFGGSVSVHSRPGEGSTFTVELPVA